MEMGQEDHLLGGKRLQGEGRIRETPGAPTTTPMDIFPLMQKIGIGQDRAPPPTPPRKVVKPPCPANPSVSALRGRKRIFSFPAPAFFPVGLLLIYLQPPPACGRRTPEPMLPLDPVLPPDPEPPPDAEPIPEPSLISEPEADPDSVSLPDPEPVLEPLALSFGFQPLPGTPWVPFVAD